mgnify:CR=1 FL=1
MEVLKYGSPRLAVILDLLVSCGGRFDLVGSISALRHFLAAVPAACYMILTAVIRGPYYNLVVRVLHYSIPLGNR